MFYAEKLNYQRKEQSDLNFIELFEEHRIPYRQEGEHHHATADWVSIDCPMCSPNSGRFRAAFNLSKGSFSCWSCGKANPVHMLADLLHIPRSKAYGLLRDALPAFANTMRQAADACGQYTPPKGRADLPEQHRAYLQKRGFDPDEIMKIWGVSGIGIHARLPWRLLLPVYDRYGREASWTTRSISDSVESRYINARPQEEKLPLKSLLYGSHLVRHAMIICEGPIDAWSIGPGAVATFGVVFTEEQFAQIAQVPIRIVCYDAEGSGQKKAKQLCRQLSAHPGTTENVRLETGKDPNEADYTEIQQLRSLLEF